MTPLPASRYSLAIAANNGELGGGEVMLLALAEAMREFGVDPLVVGPADPGGVISAATNQGFAVEALPGLGRPSYMTALRHWRKHNPGGILWCNGLVPATATWGMPGRVVHLHQIPTGLQRLLVELARLRALATVVPSEFVARKITGSVALHNWSPDLKQVFVPQEDGRVRIGFLGRLSEAKGVHVLFDAFASLQAQEPQRYCLRVAGESRFVNVSEHATIDRRFKEFGTEARRIGWIPAEEFLSSIDILVVPSVGAETFGLVVAEAMSARVPVIVTDAGALPEVVGSDHPWVARAGDAGSLADVIAAAASSLPAVDVVERAHARWVELFSPWAGQERLRGLLEPFGLPLHGTVAR